MRVRPEELMMRAIESEAGVKVTFGEETHAHVARLACYKWRTKQRKIALRRDPSQAHYGVTDFDNLHMQITSEYRKGEGAQPTRRVYVLTITQAPLSILSMEDIKSSDYEEPEVEDLQ